MFRSKNNVEFFQVKLLKRSDDKEENGSGDSNDLEEKLREQEEQTAALQKQLNQKLEDMDTLKVDFLLRLKFALISTPLFSVYFVNFLITNTDG